MRWSERRREARSAKVGVLPVKNKLHRWGKELGCGVSDRIAEGGQAFFELDFERAAGHPIG